MPDKPIWETVIEIGGSIPESELAKIPTDLSVTVGDECKGDIGAFRRMLREPPVSDTVATLRRDFEEFVENLWRERMKELALRTSGEPGDTTARVVSPSETQEYP